MSLALAIAGLGGLAAGLLGYGHSYGSSKAQTERNTLNVAQMRQLLIDNGYSPEEVDEYLSHSELEAYANQYKKDNSDWIQNLFKQHSYYTDTEALLSDLAWLNKHGEIRPEAPLMEDYLNDEYVQGLIADRESRLDALRDEYVAGYQQDLADIEELYGTQRRNLLATQSRQNAELMDTMRSEMSRSRRNALEAGASAGIRLADNINIMLSNQNKQAQTSLETSNQLAQMAINQRAATQQARGAYTNYMQQDFQNRNDLRATGRSEAMQNYNAANESFINRDAQWEDRYGHIPGANMWSATQKRKQTGTYGGSN
jgi:hypothetical protein